MLADILARLFGLGIALLAGAAMLAAQVVAIFAFAISAHRPDPSEPDGDPCCAYPDTWGEVALGSGFGVVLLGLAAGAAVFAPQGIGMVVRGRWSSWPRSGLAAATLGCFAAGMVAVLLLVS